MTTNDRTAEQEAALNLVKDFIRPHVGEMLIEYAELLAHVPDKELDQAINQLGGLMVWAFDEVAPQVSEPLRWSLPYGFVTLLKEHMANA